MRNALLFDDVIQFTDFVRVYGSNATAKSGFTLYHVRDPERPARTQLILVGFRRRKGWSFSDTPMILKELQVEEKDGKLTAKDPESTERQELDIQASTRALHLVELVELLRWKVDEEPGRLVFWLHNPKMMPRLVTDSFKLGNDRIQYAPIEQDGKQAMLLRIDAPSYYLIQWCQEQHEDEVGLFYSPCEDMYVEWGYSHPLEELWRRAQKQGDTEWIFFRHDATREHLTPPQWQDVYRAADFVLHFPVEQRWTTETDHKVRFELPLRLEPRSRPLEPELWMLREDEQYLLERLLSLVDEADLKTLLISIQEDEDGARRFFIREKHLGEGRKFLDFKGQRFASYKGFHNLLLPVEVELQPQLRRDQYRELFSLQNGQLTVLVTDTDEGKPSFDKAEILCLRENSFEPITRMIDYIIQSDREVLENILEKSIFDFGHYANAPRRPDLLDRPKKGKEKEEKQKTKKKEGKGKADNDKDAPKAKRSRKKEALKKKLEEQHEETETPKELHIEPSELEKDEARIERDLVQQGQQAESWHELSNVKGLLDKWQDATTSTVEGMWLLQAGPEYDAERDRLTQILDHYLGLKGTPGQRLSRAQKKAKDSDDPLAVAAYVLHGHDEGEDRIDDWLQQATQMMRQVEGRMRKKERWLFWREIFQRNKDNREQARVREDILKDLNDNGLTNQDIPPFIQQRLFQERWLQEDENNEGTSEVGAAYRNLELITQSVSEFPLERLRAPGLAILARAYARIGHHPRAKELLDLARGQMGALALDTKAWIHLYTFHAVSFQSKSEGETYKKEYDATCKELKKTNASHHKPLAQMEVSLEERKELENLSNYLSKDNAKRLFPANTSSASAPVKARLDAIESSYQAGELERVGKEVKGILEHISEELTGKKKDPDFRTQAWLLNSAIATLSKLKWGSEGRQLIQDFEDFVVSIPQKPPEGSGKLADFYFTLLHLAMCEGLVALGSEPIAMQHLRSLLEWTFERALVPLDYVDMCSKALTTIEVAQLKNRQEPLKLILKGMQRQVNTDSSRSSYDNPSFAAIALKLLDQTVEVALSKEKLTLGLYKRYTDQDELLIRERIFIEDACV